MCVPAPRVVMREVVQMFNKKFSLDDDVVVVTTCQRSAMELVNWGDEVAVEKDRLLEVFASFARKLCEELTEAGYWADFVDPCSGLPVLTKDCNNNCVYDEVASMQTLLKYEIYQAGPCKVLLHPKWGSAVYPASIFTTAPVDEVNAVLDKY